MTGELRVLDGGDYTQLIFLAKNVSLIRPVGGHLGVTILDSGEGSWAWGFWVGHLSPGQPD